MRVRLLAAAAALFFTSAAVAKELTFSFDVHSSGGEIYPCDAGMVQRDSGQFCHFKGTTTSCNAADIGRTPAEVGAEQAVDANTGLPVLQPGSEAHACICSGANGGAYLMNFIRYKAAPWVGTQGGSNAPNHLGWGPAVNGVVQGTANGVTVARHLRGSNAAAANNVPQELATQLEAVSFNFGSELYGAQFFVDFCYRGPQIPYYLGEGNPQNALANFSTKAHITATNPFLSGNGGRTRDYVTMSQLTMSWDMACDVQGVGAYKFDHNSAGAFDTFLTDLTDLGSRGNLPSDYVTANGVTMTPAAGTNWVGNLAGANSEFRIAGSKSYSDLVTQQQQWLFGNSPQTWVTLNSSKTPRFCKMRAYFAEKPFRDRARAWQRADARFIVFWSVEEDAQ